MGEIIDDYGGFENFAEHYDPDTGEADWDAMYDHVVEEAEADRDEPQDDNEQK